MNEESPFQVQPAYVQKTSNKKRLITIFFVVLLLIIAGLGALYLLGSSAKRSSVKPTNPIPTGIVSTPTPSASSAGQLSTTPASTNSPTVNPVNLSISILNGSGTPGAAGQVAEALKNAGFTNITTGNASSYSYEGITITVKSAENGYTQQIQKYVSTAYPNSKVTVKNDDTISSDIQIIVGK